MQILPVGAELFHADGKTDITINHFHYPTKCT